MPKSSEWKLCWRRKWTFRWMGFRCLLPASLTWVVGAHPCWGLSSLQGEHRINGHPDVTAMSINRYLTLVLDLVPMFPWVSVSLSVEWIGWSWLVAFKLEKFIYYLNSSIYKTDGNGSPWVGGVGGRMAVMLGYLVIYLVFSYFLSPLNPWADTWAWDHW